MTDRENGALLSYLQRVAPRPVVEGADELVSSGALGQCGRLGHLISGSLRDGDNQERSCRLALGDSEGISPSCSICDHQGFWCAHSAALLLRAGQLGLILPRDLYTETDPEHRTNPSTAVDIAAVLRDLSERIPDQPAEPTFTPAVSIRISLEHDHMAVQVLFNDDVQDPTTGCKHSSRSLDNVVIDRLEEHGVWNPSIRAWELHSGKDISELLGLMREFAEVKLLPNDVPFELSDMPAEARMTIIWQESGAKLAMEWRVPSGESHRVSPRQMPLVGNDPFYVQVGSVIYPVPAAAARIAALFPFRSTISLSFSQSAPLLEALHSGLFDQRYVVIHNPDAAPETQVKDPQIILDLHLRQSQFEHFSTGRSAPKVEASLSFDYPASRPKERLVILPNREAEHSAREMLESLGFELPADGNRRYTLPEDRALDLLKLGREAFPAEWQVLGYDVIKRGIRFAELAMRVEVTDRANDEGFLDCHATLLLNNSSVPISMLFKNARGDSDRWVKLDNGAYAAIPTGSLSTLKATLGTIDSNFRLAHSVHSKISRAQAIGLLSIKDSSIRLKMSDEIRKVAEQLQKFEGIKRIKASKHFEGKLRPYQEEGLSWLLFLHQFSFGGILADEMGLGKTVQALSLLQHLSDQGTKQKKKSKPSLVIAPTSVITNWWHEAKRFTPKLSTLLLHGPRRRQVFPQIREHDLVITSYALLRLDRQELERHEWNYVILDEAQVIKNFQAATTQAAKALSAAHRLALTGTPTENRPLELWSIMDFLMPGHLGTQEFFRSNIEKPILEGDPEGSVIHALHGKTKPFVLRRVKQQVEKDLPPKVESVLHVAMTESQRELYSRILHEVRPKVLQAVQKKGVAGATISILAALLRLRQVCNHPNSIDSLKTLPGYDSGKFNLLKELLEEALESGRKILLFGQFKEMLAIIRRHLEQTGVEYLYLDGATRDRHTLVQRFNTDDNVRLFLISLKAGGLGLNLTGADMVVLYDPWWNPAVEAQAIDRAHRIGQRRTVHVYRLVTEDSIEQKIMELKRKKARITEALVNDSAVSPLALTKAEVEQLFSPLTEQELS